MSGYFSEEILDEEHLLSWLKMRSELFQRPMLLLLYGSMGVGKTTFVKHLVKVLGGKEDVLSPTFALHHSYSVDEGFIEHWDLHRIETPEDLESTGFWDQFMDESSFIIVEWADHLCLELLPKHWNIFSLSIELRGEESRMYKLSQIF